MDPVVQHQGLRDGWAQQSLAYQIGNIGSEVSRSLKNVDKPARFKGAYQRALELFDFTIQSEREKGHAAGQREMQLAKEEFCDYFNGNTFHTDPQRMMRYYDQFAMLANAERIR